MNIKKIVEEYLISHRETKATILEIYKAGSQVLRPNPHDLDFQIILSGYSQRFSYYKIEENGIRYDLFLTDIEVLKKELTFGSMFYSKVHTRLYNYFYALKETIYGDCRLSYNMLEFEAPYKDYLKKDYSKHTQIGSSTSLKQGKFYVHYYIVLKIYENRIVKITKDMKSDIESLYSDDETSTPVKEWVIQQIDIL